MSIKKNGFMSNNVKPTDKQKATLVNLMNNPDLSLGEAMRKAGYSEESSLKPKQNFTDRKGTFVAMEKWRDELAKVGITQDFFAKKYWEWLNAQKIKSSMTEPDKIVPDYQIQIKAAEFVRNDWGMLNEAPPIQNNILIMPKDIIDSYGIAQNTGGSSPQQTNI